ncbi:cGMP-dependent protein kinase 1 [Gurleya vavrai]
MKNDFLDSFINKILAESETIPTADTISVIKQFYTFRNRNNDKFSEDVLRKAIDEVSKMSEEAKMAYIQPDDIRPISEIDVSQRRESFCMPGVTYSSNRQFEIVEKTEAVSDYLLGLIRKSILRDVLTLRQQVNLVSAMRPLMYDNNVMIEQGEKGDTMYFVERGKFEVIKDGIVIDTRGEGSLIGEIALLHQVRRTATVKAVGKALVWAVNHTAYLAIKIVDDMYRYNIVKTAADNDKRFKGRKYCFNTVVFYSGDFIDETKYFISSMVGTVCINGENKKIEKGTVLTGGRIVNYIEGAYLILNN